MSTHTTVLKANQYGNDRKWQEERKQDLRQRLGEYKHKKYSSPISKEMNS